MIRPRLHEALGFAVQARLSMEEMKKDILEDVRSGYVPTYRGHPWSKKHFDAIEGASMALDACFHFLKWLQFPEVDSRLAEAVALLQQIDGSNHDGGDSGNSTTQSPPGDEPWKLNHHRVELRLDPHESVM